MNNYINLFYISLLIIFARTSYGQVIISNPSLEDKPADATMPPGWFAASDGTTPDILPGYWGVYNDAEDGETFVGLITRKDGSFESISQRLEGNLDKGLCYTMSLALAYSEDYAGYNHPLRLRVWISNKKNKRQQMVFESPLITAEEWAHFLIEFFPEKKMKYIIIEAYNEDKQPHEGNILLDAITNPVICNKA